MPTPRWVHKVVEDQAALDRYQEAPLHGRFIEENRANGKKVRGFDSLVVS